MGSSIFLVAYGIFSCSMWTLSCGGWDAVLCLENWTWVACAGDTGVLATGPPEKSLLDCFRNIISVNLHKSHMRWEFLAFIFPLEEEMATHSSILTWKIPWTEEPGGLQSVELQKVGHNWVTEHTPQVGGEQFSLPPLISLCSKLLQASYLKEG